MNFPLPNKRRAVGRLWGPREWNGAILNHNGIDQTFGDGTSVVVEHPGKLAGGARHRMDSGGVSTLSGIGHDRIFGFYSIYQVTPELRVSYHQLRAQFRGAQTLTPGLTSVGLVGNPLVSMPLAQRKTKSNWSGPEAGLSNRSGPHLHTQCWRLQNGIYEPINPDSQWVQDQINKAMEDDMPNYRDWDQRDKEALHDDLWGIGVRTIPNYEGKRVGAKDILSATEGRAKSAQESASSAARSAAAAEQAAKAKPAAQVDASAVAKALATDQTFLIGIAKAVVDEQHRRLES